MREHTRRISRRVFLGGALTFGAVYLANPSIAFAVTAAEKQAEADAVRDQVTAMQTALDKASNDYYTALDEHDKAVAAKDDAQAQIDATNQQIADIQSQLATRARSMYKSGGISFLDVILASTSFEDFTTNWSLLNQMNQKDADMVQQAKDLRTQLQAQKDEYAKQEQIAADKTAEALAIKTQAEQTVNDLQTLLDSLDAEAKKLLEQEQQAAAEAAAAAQRAAIAAQQEADAEGNPNAITYSPGGTDIPAKGTVVDYAISRLGCPYVWGATGPDTFDCSGLTSWCYNQIGIWITRTTWSQYAAASAVLPMESAQPGDVLYNGGHVAVCTQPGGVEYIHAPQTGDVVRYATWSQFYCALRF
ncbi:MAG: NlpC/P60 family protein [Eggerthellaceae bacterium]|nr:NlpC/P60 family protein [Eggerthellaceae bacterium]